MSASHFKRHFTQFFKYVCNTLLVVSLVLGGSVTAAQAASPAVTDQSALKAPLFVPNANVTFSIHPLERVMIGEDFEFYVAFDNPSVDVGYGPFVDLIFPSNGADGAAGTDTPDGIDFVSATLLGYNLTAISQVFPDDDGPGGPGTTGCVDHPFAIDTLGAPAQVCGTTADTLVVLELPFSSITQGMPKLSVDVNAHVSDLADVDTALTILGRGGFRFGGDSLNNPSTDPAILNPASTDGSGWPMLTVTPRVIHIEKSFDGPAECPYDPDQMFNGVVLDDSLCYGEVNPVYESVSGPNFPRQYSIKVYVAAGQTINNLVVTDYFPNNVAYLSVDPISSPIPSSIDEPTVVGAAANSPDNELIVTFTSLSGSAEIVVNFFIPEFLPDGVTPILDPATGASAIADNIASALGDWTPVDPRDPGGPGNAIANGPCPGQTCVPLHTLNIRSIAVQKSVEIVDDLGVPGYSPGDVLKYTLNFQISDYFGFGDLVLTDVLRDGQHFFTNSDFRARLSVSDRNTILIEENLSYIYSSTPMPTDELTIDESKIDGSGIGFPVDDGTDGSTTLTFNVSAAMTNISADDGVLEGGEAGYDVSISPTTPATGADPAMGLITYFTMIEDDFTDFYPSGDSSVDHGDALFNSVTINGTIANEDATLTANTQTNDSAQKIKIVYDGFEKSIYAVNGNTTFSSPFTTPAAVEPGDTITFRLRQSLPSSDSDALILTDFLPLPIFDAAEIIAFDDLTDGDVPVAGRAKFGPDSTLNAALAVDVLPMLIADAAANSLSFDFGTFDDPADTTTKIDVLFTVTVSNAPYVDGAVLTNLALGLEDTTNSYLHINIGADQFTLKEPGISLRKGVVASDNGAAVFVPNPPGPVTFNAPGSSPSWSGVIASGDKDPITNLINSDVENVMGGDLLTFAIVLENLGSSSLGAFDLSVQDSLPADLEIPAGGINLQARRGDGAAVTFAPVGSTATDPSGLFDDGIVFTDESTTQGVTHVYSPSGGQNLIVITYDLQIATTASVTFANTATLLSYAGTDGGPNHVGATPTNNVQSDDATTTLVNLAPVIAQGSDVTVPMSEDNSPTVFNLALTASDPNNDPLTWSIFVPASHGTAGVTAGTVSYAPTLNYNGPDSFVVQVSDGLLTDEIIVNVDIDAVIDNLTMIWNQNYGIQYDSWLGSEDTNAAFTFASGYRKAKSGTFAFNPTVAFNKFIWITYRGPDQGKARVYVDGVLKKTVDLYSPTPEWQYFVEVKGLTNGKHNVVVKPLNARNAASSDNWVAVDGFKIGGTTYDDDYIRISGLYSYGSWLGLSNDGPRFKAYRISSVKNASMKFSFEGTEFIWVTARGPAYGKARIYVDGVPVRTVDLYRARQQWRHRVTVDDLTFGNHVVEIRVLHTKNPSSSGFGVVSDGFELD